MSDYKIDIKDEDGLRIPSATIEEQKKVVAEIESRIAQGEEKATVLKDVFDRLDQIKR